MSRDRVENRAHLIYDFLTKNLGRGYTITDLCRRLGLQPGSTTTAAIRRARDLATEAGYHFPPAVPAKDFRYMVTNLPGDALDPTLHMARIESGVRARKDVGVEFMRKRLRNVDPEDRPVARALLNIERKTEQALASIRRETDDMLLEMVKLRRGQRQS